MNLTTVHPTEGETYNIGFDDHCLYVTSNHLSRSMCKWISENYIRIFEENQ